MTFVLLHGFAKKTDAVSRSDIELADIGVTIIYPAGGRGNNGLERTQETTHEKR